ncbi:hypothetical protein [Capnocytophaga sp.]|uniref:DUF6929 family protein n=1 Tax=Capnocytophaga sp. TaxID=44737 RepID=UPI0026DD1775|nr:hypothetical protein [Capnocytophaga sp.]MDO5106103.1 hypothetical protein [Capnocytophaga sp.]
MKIKITEMKHIADFPSGSGIGQQARKYYAIGDDSPFLYVFDSNFQLTEKIDLVNPNDFEFKKNRIKKKQKPDFETLEFISKNELAIFGSGSKSPQRDIFIRVFLDETAKIHYYNLTEFYNHLKQLPELENAELNIEATAFADGFLYLFNRANNLIMRFNYDAFTAYLTNGKIPEVEVKRIELPQEKNVQIGFSGATAIDVKTILFTASAEASDDAYNDGEIIGSWVGELDISDFKYSTVKRYGIIPSADKPLKVESVALCPSAETDTVKVVFITDDDNGNTEIISAFYKRY